MTGRIDVHHHLIPDFYRRALGDEGIRQAGGRQLPNWDVEGLLELMDLLEARTAIVCISTPGVGFIEQPNAPPSSHGSSTTSPPQRAPTASATSPRSLCPIPASVAEAERALDERGADGVVLLANNRGVYLGAGGQDPLFGALEDRGAIVFIHPAELPCPAVDGIVPFAADCLLDTPAPPTCSCATGW